MVFKSLKKMSFNPGLGSWSRSTPEPYDLAGAGAILLFLQEPEREPEHFKNWNGTGSGIN